MRNFIKFTCLAAAAIFVAAQAHATVYLQDNFTYADGEITNNSGGVWTGFSGSSPVNVTNGHAIVSAALTQDVAANLTGSPHSSDVLYAMIDFWADALPTGTSSYFMMFKDSGVSSFMGRTFLTITGAAVGNYRVGMNASTGGGPTTIFASDITLGSTNRLVLKVDQTGVNTPVVTLWLNPTLETDANVSVTGSLANLAISTIAFRQATLEGRVNVDDLVVGDSFSAVTTVPEPSTMTLIGFGVVGLLAFLRRGVSRK